MLAWRLPLYRNIIAEHDINQMENVRQDILSRVSHEFRTPLTSILGYAEVILEDPLLPDELRRQFVQTIKDEGQRLAELVNELVSLQSFEQGLSNLERAEIDLLSLLEHAFQAVDGHARDRSVIISFKAHQTGITGNWDKQRLFEMLLHLLTNAIKFAPVGGSIKVAIRCIESQVELVITNDESVISPRELPFVFDPLYQFQLRTGELSRPGVGLAIAKRIIELHGGTLIARENGDSGSSFAVSLPLRQKAKLSRKKSNATVVS